METDWQHLYSEHFVWDGKCYLVHIYRRCWCHGRGSHMAETVLGAWDRIISDGGTPEEALQQQLTVLPAAILSRALL